MATVSNQLRDESIAHAIWISRYSTGVASRMVKLLNESDAELTARLLVAMDGIEPNSFTVTRLEALLASVREINRTAINGMFSSLSTELNDLAKHEAGYLFFLMLAGVSVDRRQCHHRLNPNLSIGEDPVNSLSQFAQNDIFCTGQTIKIPFVINEFHEHALTPLYCV